MKNENFEFDSPLIISKIAVKVGFLLYNTHDLKFYMVQFLYLMIFPSGGRKIFREKSIHELRLLWRFEECLKLFVGKSPKSRLAINIRIFIQYNF